MRSKLTNYNNKFMENTTQTNQPVDTITPLTDITNTTDTTTPSTDTTNTTTPSVDTNTPVADSTPTTDSTTPVVDTITPTNSDTTSTQKPSNDIPEVAPLTVDENNNVFIPQPPVQEPFSTLLGNVHQALQEVNNTNAIIQNYNYQLQTQIAILNDARSIRDKAIAAGAILPDGYPYPINE